MNFKTTTNSKLGPIAAIKQIFNHTSEVSKLIQAAYLYKEKAMNKRYYAIKVNAYEKGVSSDGSIIYPDDDTAQRTLSKEELRKLLKSKKVHNGTYLIVDCSHIVDNNGNTCKIIDMIEL